MDRVDFEELALHSVDTSLGPQATNLGQPNVSVDEKHKRSVPLICPSDFASRISPIKHLQAMVSRRTPDHKAGMWRWGVIAVVVSPFGILPIIPNFPLYFAAWRAWSHYKAYKACEHLETLIKHDVIYPQADTKLDSIYHNFMLPPPEPTNKHPPSTNETTEENATVPTSEELVLSRDAIPKIISLFELPQAVALDISRAIKQTLGRLSKSKSKSKDS